MKKVKKLFKIRLGPHSFSKGDILLHEATGEPVRIRITKVYKDRWYKSVLGWLGFDWEWILFRGVKAQIEE